MPRRTQAPPQAAHLGQVPRRHRRAGYQAGFTLIEVLVALAVIGVALAAVVRAVSLMTTNNGTLRDRTLALLSAENRMHELEIDPTLLAADPPRVACPQGHLRLTCVQRIDQLKTGFREVTIDVYRDNSSARVATLSKVISPS